MFSLRIGSLVGLSWHLLLCKPNQNERVCDQLSRRGIDVFMPRHNVTVRQRGRLVHKTAPVFSGYVFFGQDPKAPQWREVRHTPGVSRLLLDGRQHPALVPAPVVAGLMLRCGSNGILQPDDDLDVGDRVRILSGPFADFVSTVEEIGADRRVMLLLDMMGGTQKVGVDAAVLTREPARTDHRESEFATG